MGEGFQEPQEGIPLSVPLSVLSVSVVNPLSAPSLPSAPSPVTLPLHAAPKQVRWARRHWP